MCCATRRVRYSCRVEPAVNRINLRITCRAFAGRASALRLLPTLVHETPQQHPHRVDRLDTNEWEITEEKSRIAKCRETIRLVLMLDQPRPHPAAYDIAAKALAVHPGSGSDSPKHVESRNIEPLLESSAKDSLVVGRKDAGLTREFGALQCGVGVDPPVRRRDLNSGLRDDVHHLDAFDGAKRVARTGAMIAQRDRHALP